VAYRGVHFALSDSDLIKLLRARSNDELLEVIQNEIEERWDERWLYQTDKAWDAIHRCLTDGKIGFDNGEYPWKVCILGGRQLYSGNDYIISLKTPKQVSDLAESLASITQEAFRQRYFSIRDPEYIPGISAEDFEYTWDWFNGLPDFFARSAAAGRSVIFTVDQ
jgi:hypothetical protein